jgi:hypothetical protein
VRLGEILFPYRAERPFGIVSFSFVFLLLFVEIEVLVFIGLGLVARRADLFLDLQYDVVPAAALVSLVASAVFAWRARAWTRAWIKALREWDGAATRSYAETIASRRGSNEASRPPV